MGTTQGNALVPLLNHMQDGKASICITFQTPTVTPGTVSLTPILTLKSPSFAAIAPSGLEVQPHLSPIMIGEVFIYPKSCFIRS